LIEYTERLVRAEIATWPDGRYTFTDYLDSDGVGGGPVKIQVALTVDGDSLTADFTGTSPQVRGALNATPSFTTSAVALCIRGVLKGSIPNTEGMFRPIHMVVPEGSVLHGRMPAASSMRGVTGFRVVDAVFGALAKFLPDRVFAACDGGNSLVILGGQRDNGDPYIFYELISGTWGARPDRDANDGLCNPANVNSNIPVEQAECEYPLLIEKYGLVDDSGGPGQFRGGMGVERAWKLLAGEAQLTIRSDRRDHPPYGLAGGKPGMGSTTILIRDGVSEELPTCVTTRIKAGDRLYHRHPGGGGWGDPLQRDPAAVHEDVRNNRVSVEAAHDEYGLMVELDVDQVASTSLQRMTE
jgi:N-methylhydantoinase B